MKGYSIQDLNQKRRFNLFFRILHLVFVLFDIYLMYFFSFQFYDVYGIPLWLFHIVVTIPSILYQLVPSMREDKGFRQFLTFLSFLSIALSITHYILYLQQEHFEEKIMYWLMFMTSALPTAAISITLLLSMLFEKELHHHLFEPVRNCSQGGKFLIIPAENMQLQKNMI